MGMKITGMTLKVYITIITIEGALKSGEEE